MLRLQICTSIVYLFGAGIQTQSWVHARRAFYQLNCIFCHHKVLQESLTYVNFFLFWSYMFVLSATTYIIWFLKLLLYLLLSLAFAQSSTFSNPIAKWMLCCCFLRINIIPCFLIQWIFVECLLISKIMTCVRFRNCGKLHNLKRAPYFKGKRETEESWPEGCREPLESRSRIS